MSKVFLRMQGENDKNKIALDSFWFSHSNIYDGKERLYQAYAHLPMESPHSSQLMRYSLQTTLFEIVVIDLVIDQSSTFRFYMTNVSLAWNPTRAPGGAEASAIEITLTFDHLSYTANPTKTAQRKAGGGQPGLAMAIVRKVLAQTG